MNDIEERRQRFLKTTRENPPQKGKAKLIFEKYLGILECMTNEDWERFFYLSSGESKPSDMVRKDPAVAEMHPADNAYYLLEQARFADMEWYQRYQSQLIKFGLWVTGLPLIGGVIEWLISNGAGFFGLGFIHYPNIFQTEEYVLLALVGAWVASVSKSEG